MNTVISVYNSKAYKEFVLPNINNSNYSIILEKDIYSLSKDIVINFDVIENVWRVLGGKNYNIKKESIYLECVEIKSDLNIEIITDDGAVIRFSSFDSKKNILHSKKYFIRKKTISIGSAEDNDIVCKNSFVSSHHARIFFGKDGWYVEDLSQNGVFLNSVRVRVNSLLEFGDFINIIGLKIVFFDNMIALNEGESGNVKVNLNSLSNEPPEQKKIDKADMSENNKEFFNRAPRVLRELHTEMLEIEAPPAPKQNSPRSLFMTIGPSFTMAIPMLLGCILMIYSSRNAGQQASPMMFTGLITAVASATLGAFWAILNYKNSNSQTYKEEKHRFEAYSDYLMRSAEKIKNLNSLNAEIMNEIYPSATECAGYDNKNSKLWNRNESHSDFLSHRIGLGDIPFQAEIQIPKEKFTLVDDSLAEKPKLIKNTYSTLKNVPICLDMKENKLIGIVGGRGKAGAYDILKTLSVQIATSNCYTDVKLCYMFKEGCFRNSLSFAKWLPHTWSEDKKTRFCAFSKEDASDLCYELTKIFRLRDETAKENRNNAANKPHYIIFIEDISLLEGEPLAKYIFDSEADYGLTVVLFAENYENLPNTCECIVYNDKNFTGIYTPKTLSSLGNKISYDLISDDEIENMSRTLLKIEVAEVETGGEIPGTLTFLDMYGVENVEMLNVIERWKKNRTYENMRALIGQKAGGAECYLDIHEKYHGPHGLVAGTTGSGKSETLQTYILSLAINYSPDDIGFLLVDFKGGGMANLFTDLPHTIGQISNLSGAQVRRAMISIKSENLRRQRILSEHGVNNINAYTRLLKNEEATIPMPHLFIIIDEFAELKREEPEFMSELISVAQVGRSLGVHLILATQKPGGTVDDNIRSNSKFKLCLRVQDKQDSTEMLGKPEAAYLSQAGRCYLQVGNDEIFELFQSGWSGAVYDAALGGKNNPVKLISDTGKTALSGNKTALKQKEVSRRNWLDSFAQCVFAVAKENGIELSDVIFKTEKMNELLDNLFDMLEQMDMSFVRNRYNETAAKNLIELIGSFNEENVESIIESALKQNIILPEPKELTQLDAVIEYVKNVAQTYNYQRQVSLWLPMLSETFYLDSIEEYNKQKYNKGSWQASTEWSLIAPVGLCDDPENQAQMPLWIDFSNGGHLAVCGNVTSGKSTFLQTLIYSLINLYSPEQLSVYAIDFSSHLLQAFEPAPHVGGIMFENDLEKIDKFFNMIEQMLSQRKKVIGGGNYGQYVKVNGYKFPSVVIAIDNYASFREKTDDKYEKVLWEISRDGAGLGVFLAISAGGFGSLDIQNKIAENLRNVVALDMGEKMKYCDVLRTNRFDVLPSEGIRGRGLVPYIGTVLEFHTALCIPANDDYDRIEKVQSECNMMKAGYTGRIATPVPEIPEKPSWDTISNNEQFIQDIKESDKLPIAYETKTAAIYSVNLFETFCYLIQGKGRSGRTNILKIMAASAKQKGSDVFIIDADNASLQQFGEKLGVKYISTQSELFDFCKELTPIFQKRNAIKKEMLALGAEDEEIFVRMSNEKPIFIFVSSFSDFLKKVYSYREGFGTMNGFFENILEKGYLHNIYFVFDSNLDEVPEIAGRKIYNIVTDYKIGIHLGGNLGHHNQKVFDVSGISYQERDKAYRPGEGMAFETNKNIKVVVPFSKGL